VRNSRTFILDDRIRPEIYIPLEQGRRWNSTVLIRARNGSVGVAATIAQELRQLDPTLPPVQVDSMAERMAQGLSDQRLYAELTSLFSVLALLLAAIGLYGTMALAVSQRTHEIGIRMALGAQRADVLWMVIREGLVVTSYGVAVGLVGSFALTRLLASHLYGVTPTDPVAFATSTLVLMAAAFLACWVPASRATKVDPLSALRYE
jgi:putative ABC transport system permease protein